MARRLTEVSTLTARLPPSIPARRTGRPTAARTEVSLHRAAQAARATRCRPCRAVDQRAVDQRAVDRRALEREALGRPACKAARVRAGPFRPRACPARTS